MRFLGLDLGKKTIGVAISDETGLTAQPFAAIKKASLAKDLDAIAALIEQYSVKHIVAGMPVNMNGTIGPRGEEAQRFIESLREKTGLPVTAWDERLSTVAVERVLIDGDVSRARRKEVVDKLAAAYILQGYLDSRRVAS
ncbi:MAG: Holliday junction resolvase RuvX [Deltaproteobacteria bacterium]|nr:Holliday junction resolvase RuvX [Deltaproteobacteria bacterium]